AASGLYCEAAFQGKPQHEHLPTQNVERSHFLDAIGELSGLPTSKMTLCLDRLSFGWQSNDKPDVFLQPLLATDTHISWSPHLISISKYERNMLKMMSRNPSLKMVADNLIGRREHVLSRLFGKTLSEYGYQYKPAIDLPGNLGEIDLLAYRPKYK